jgi:hypothetical protein
MKEKSKHIPKVASSSMSPMTSIKKFLLESLVKPIFHTNVVHEVLFLKCNDQI